MSDTKKANPQEKIVPALIYVVDDEAMLLELAKVILAPLGYKVQTFRDPDAAVETYQKTDQRPELIITDYSMHNMTGMDLIAECRRLQPSQKIILVSGTVGEEIYRDSAVKPDRFLAKPYEIRQLTDTIRTLLD